MKKKLHKYIIFILLGVMIIWLGYNIIGPTIIAASNGEEWEKVLKAIVHMKMNEVDAVQMNDEPVLFLEKEEGMLKLYLEEKGYLVEYFGTFLECNYTDQQGNKIELQGRKCTEYYTVWYQYKNE